jgi:phosphatidylethanolamine-binding protein
MIMTRLMNAEIIPTVINDFIPTLKLTVSWPDKTAKLGNTIKPNELQDVPIVKLHEIPSSPTLRSSGLTYTIALTDPDAPSRDNPEWSEICHWIATKVPVSSSSTEQVSNVQKLKEIMPWKPPGPPSKTGKHRYVFLVFAPANGTTKKLQLSKPSDRQHWGTGKERHGVRDWAEENGLAPVGKWCGHGNDVTAQQN